MKRVFLLLFIALITFLLIALYKNPELLNDIWLWLSGLVGLIIKGGQRILNYFAGLFSSEDKKTGSNSGLPQPATGAGQATAESNANGVTLTLLRYLDDGETTIGLLYVNDAFYCYTLEDTFQKVKIAGSTRIPAGRYAIKFREEETELTQEYRTRYPEWFVYHLELQNVPQFSAVYIHNGGDHTDTEGCILVSDSISVEDENTYLTNSRTTFKRLYVFLQQQMTESKKIFIDIKDELWFKNAFKS